MSGFIDRGLAAQDPVEVAQVADQFGRSQRGGGYGAGGGYGTGSGSSGSGSGSGSGSSGGSRGGSSGGGSGGAGRPGQLGR